MYTVVNNSSGISKNGTNAPPTLSIPGNSVLYGKYISQKIMVTMCIQEHLWTHFGTMPGAQESIHSMAKSIPRLHKRLQIRAQGMHCKLSDVVR
jgi:hypothetical protein